MLTTINRSISLALTGIILLSAVSCKKFVTLDTPENSLIDKTTFSKERTATGAVLDAYQHLAMLHANPNSVCVSKASGLYADELTLTGTNATLTQLYTNSLDALQEPLNVFWNDAYTGIYKVNAVIDGVKAYGQAIPENSRNQILGEAMFVRAFFYFLLTNMYGDVPLVLTTDYQTNSRIAKSASAVVYDQIVKDLTEARTLIGEEYLDGVSAPATTRFRPNKDVVAALLSRVSLYRGDWANAEQLATSVIDKGNVYSLAPDLKQTFTATSSEAVFQIYSFFNWATDVYDLSWIGEPTTDLMWGFSKLSNPLMNRFEPGDRRLTEWIDIATNGTENFPYVRKYYDFSATYQTPIRLAELYLIRAEARIQQPGKIAAGIEDINEVRRRARADATAAVPDPLPDLATNLTKKDAMLALEKERQTELFTEGHRWFDLKRWKGFDNASVTRADEVMPGILAAKGATAWKPDFAVFPIPQVELDRNVDLRQNEAYK